MVEDVIEDRWNDWKKGVRNQDWRSIVRETVFESVCATVTTVPTPLGLTLEKKRKEKKKKKKKEKIIKNRYYLNIFSKYG